MENAKGIPMYVDRLINVFRCDFLGHVNIGFGVGGAYGLMDLLGLFSHSKIDLGRGTSNEIYCFWLALITQLCPDKCYTYYSKLLKS